MAYTLHQVITKSELDRIVDVMWCSMPGIDPSHPVFFPILGDGPDARTESLIESKERIWKQHISNPASHWIYIRDDITLEIVAGCQRRIYDDNPFPQGPSNITAFWWPKGSVGRRFASEVVSQLYAPRALWMARPHTGLSAMCVLPKHQRKGLGTMLMHWGLERTDSRHIESFIEATKGGQHLYEKFGYRRVKIVTVETSCVEAAAEDMNEWKRLEQYILPVGYTALWRQVEGRLDPDDFEKTWAARLNYVTDQEVIQAVQ